MIVSTAEQKQYHSAVRRDHKNLYTRYNSIVPQSDEKP